jgi:hypothetical protein
MSGFLNRLSVRPERSAKREVEGRLARLSELRPSTSLRTNEALCRNEIPQ